MASKRALRRRACTRKVKHKTIEDAWAECDRMKRRYGTLLNPYRCKFCGGYHIGHDPDRMHGKVHIFLRCRRK